MIACNSLLLTNVMEQAVLPANTLDCGVKLSPRRTTATGSALAIVMLGLTEASRGTGLTTSTVADPLIRGKDPLCAATTTGTGGGISGAWYSPVELMLPTVLFPPA
jgi:hypothetical protein